MALLALAAVVVPGLPGCLGPRGVDYSVDRAYRFDRIRRVAIVAPDLGPRFAGLAGPLTDAAAGRLARRYHVYYGNGLDRLVAAAGVARDYQALQTAIRGGVPVDTALMAKVARAIGVDAFFYQTIGNLQQFLASGPTYSTVEVNRHSGYGTITQNPSTAILSIVRLGARLYDAESGLVVWTGSKEITTTDDLADTGFGPIFRGIDEALVSTIPVKGGASHTARPRGRRHHNGR